VVQGQTRCAHSCLMASGFIEDDRHFVRLRASTVLFARPWAHKGFTGIWGTNGMKFIRIDFSAGKERFEIFEDV
jgi:hypothetical protein